MEAITEARSARSLFASLEGPSPTGRDDGRADELLDLAGCAPADIPDTLATGADQDGFRLSSTQDRPNAAGLPLPKLLHLHARLKEPLHRAARAPFAHQPATKNRTGAVLISSSG